MSDDLKPSPLARAGMYALAVLLGGIYGAVATIGHRQSVTIGEVVVPWGLVVAWPELPQRRAAPVADA